MAEPRKRLGRGIGALIPTVEAASGKQPAARRPVDIFFEDEKRPEPTGPVVHANSSEPSTSDPTDHPRLGQAQSTDNHVDLPDDLKPIPGAHYAEVPVAQVVANAQQPRQVFDEEELEELADSIREVGILQPIVIRPLPEADQRWNEGGRFELIMGERRLRASQHAERESIPAIVRQTEDSDLLREALLENLHRVQLNPLEEAAAYEQLLVDFECTQEELSRRIARSRPQISNTLRLLKLPPLVQRRVAAGVLSAGHARALLGLTGGGEMERMAQRIVAEGLSVRATEEIVAMGEGPDEPEQRRRRAPSAHSEVLERLGTRLADRFDTRVKVTMGARRGKISVDFASIEDLERILDVLAPGEAVARRDADVAYERPAACRASEA